MRSAICISGLTRSYRHTAAAFQSNVLGPLRERGPVDVFVSIWDERGLGGASSDLSLTELDRLYEPVALDVESYETVKAAFQLSRFTSRECPVPVIVKDGVLLSIPAQYKVLQANQLKRRAEGLGGFTYDLVMRARFDMIITPLRVDELDLSRVNCLYDHDGTMGDYLYITSSERMDRLCDVYANYPMLLNLTGTDMGPERNLKHWADFCGLQSKVMERYAYALVRDGYNDVFRWDGVDYRPQREVWS